jgi:rod shape determining protein RodA
MIDRQLINHFDWKVVGVILILFGMGLLTLYSVTVPSDGQAVRHPLYMKQIYWMILGLGLFFAMAFVDYHFWVRFSPALYIGSVLFLVLVLFIGRVGQGARRWLSLGLFDFQPSEWVKLTLIIVLAHLFSRKYARGGLSFLDLVTPLAICAIPLVLILKQPDLGTGLVILAILGTMVFVVGLQSRTLGYGLFLSLMAFPFFWVAFWKSLKSYQKDRLLTFLNPSADPTGTGYHVLQSKIAIGSGGFWGKGLWGGTQSQLRFLPEGHTDFIFAVFAEQWGFMGVLVLMALYGYLLWWGIEVAMKAKDAVGGFMAAGIVTLLLFYLAVNIGMTVGLLPVVGIPLPFMSYGGNSLLTMLVGMGLLLSIKMRRFMLFY